MQNNPLPGEKRPYIALPAHWNCRSGYAPILKTFKELGLPFDEFSASTRASMDGQVPADMTFEQFLTRKGREWQDTYLGPGRAQMWRDGKITLSDLVSGTGRELTLAQLVALGG